MALMSEPVPGGDETRAQDVDTTAVVPNSTPPDAAELAWSDSDEGNTTGVVSNAIRQSWRSTWGRAAALVAGGVVLASGIVLASWMFSVGDPPASNAPEASSTSAAQKPAASPTSKSTTKPASPSSIASTPDQDDKYVAALNDRGISFANPQAAIYNGKMVCQDLDRGVSVQQEADAFRASNPGLSASANTYVAISVRSYCPQNNALVAGF
jgi:hypothetical protein